MIEVKGYSCDIYFGRDMEAVVEKYLPRISEVCWGMCKLYYGRAWWKPKSDTPYAEIKPEEIILLRVFGVTGPVEIKLRGILAQAQKEFTAAGKFLFFSLAKDVEGHRG